MFILGRISFEESIDCKPLKILTEGIVWDFLFSFKAIVTSSNIVKQKHLSYVSSEAQRGGRLESDEVGALYCIWRSGIFLLPVKYWMRVVLSPCETPLRELPA